MVQNGFFFDIEKGGDKIKVRVSAKGSLVS